MEIFSSSVFTYYIGKAVAWTGLQGLNTISNIAIDGDLKNQISKYKNCCAAWTRGKLAQSGIAGDNPTEVSTNHDLIRALRSAWIAVAREKLSEIRTLQRDLEQSPDHKNWPGLMFLADTLAEELRKLDVDLLVREREIQQLSTVEEALLRFVEVAPEQTRGQVDDDTADEFTNAFVQGVLALPVEWGPTKEEIKKILKRPVELKSRELTVGEAVLDRFVENLKSGHFKEASQAYHILVGGLIRDKLSELQDNLSEGLQAVSEEFAELREIIQLTPDTQNRFHELLSEQNEQTITAIEAVEREVKALATLVAAREHDFISVKDQVSQRRERLKGFYGRSDELEQVFQRFKNSSKSLTVITAPAGTGKSGFMVELEHMAKDRGFSVASHLISRDFRRTYEPDDVLGFLTLQIRALGIKPDQRRLDRDIKSLQDELHKLLVTNRNSTNPMVILIDGLDELHGSLPVFLPSSMGENIHVIVSCRTGNRQEKPPILFDWLGFSAATAVESDMNDLRFHLAPLSKTDVALWLKAKLGNIEILDTLTMISRLEKASDGLAIFLRYLIEDIQSAFDQGKSLQNIETQINNLPAPFTDYLSGILNGRHDGVGNYNQQERHFLGVLAHVVAPISQGELASMQLGLDIKQLSTEVRRWISEVSLPEGDGWSLQHPRLNAAFIGALDFEAVTAAETLESHCWKAWQTRSRKQTHYAARAGLTHMLSDGCARQPTSEELEQIISFFCDINFLAWRLEISPMTETIDTITTDFDRITNITRKQERELLQFRRFFVSGSPHLKKEVSR